MDLLSGPVDQTSSGDVAGRFATFATTLAAALDL